MPSVEALAREGVSVEGINLNRADLSRADLYGADLRHAHLIKAYLNGADLSGTDLSGADLSDAKRLLSDQLELACAAVDKPPSLSPPLRWNKNPCLSRSRERAECAHPSPTYP